MAVVELYDSYETHETVYGTTTRRVFSCTWTDYDDGTFAFYVGDAYSTDRQDLRISDITKRAVDNTNVRVTVLYSTDTKVEGQQGNPNQVSSWEERLDIRTEQSVVSTYTNYTNRDSTKDDPATTSETWSGSNPLYKYERTASFTITMYASKLYAQRILTNIGKMNNVRFLTKLFDKQAIEDDTDSFIDTGHWLFVGCPIERVRFGVWRYDFTFLYNDVHWYEQDGVQHNMYRAIDFFSLFTGMRSTETPKNESSNR